MSQNKEKNLEKLQIAAMAEPYSLFAGLYDHAMEHVDFPGWARYLWKKRRGFSPVQSVIDLGCGTGSLLFELHRLAPALQLYGLDRSCAMLDLARRQLPGASFFRGDLACPDRTVKISSGWLISTHDSLNYLPDKAALASHFQSAFRLLDSGGLYSFDLVTETNILENFAGKIQEEQIGHTTILQKHSYSKNNRRLCSLLVFHSSGEARQEEHVQTYFDLEEVQSLLRKTGFRILAVEGNYSCRKYRPDDDFYNFHVYKEK